MRTLHLFILAAFVITVLHSCAIFEEKPLTDTPVKFTNPTNLSTVTSLNITFTWTEVTSSSPFKYNLQVNLLDSRNNKYLVIDTTLKIKLKYNKQLAPGNYLAEMYVSNGSSQSKTDSVFFTVDTSQYVTGSITIIAPANGITNKSGTVSFSWEPVTYATKYRIEVNQLDATSGNVMANIVNADTVAPKYVYTFSPGTYQWRVKALNTVSETDFTADRTFIVDTTNSVAAANVVLVFPTDLAYVNTKIATFKWQTVSYATTYELQVASPNFISLSNIIIDRLVTGGDTVVVNLPADGIYQWRVAAKNATTESQPSVVRSFTLLTKTPATPSLLLPANNSTVTSSIVSFKWSKDANTTDSVFVYGSDSTTMVTGFPFSNSFSSAVGSYDYVLTSGLYFWTVRSTDRALNVSGYSAKYKFTVP